MKINNMKLINLLVGVFSTLVIIVFCNYMSISKRLDVLENQVSNDHELIMKYSANVKLVNYQLSDIKSRIIDVQKSVKTTKK
jgi:wobble nucleotide-excising tRNase